MGMTKEKKMLEETRSDLQGNDIRYINLSPNYWADIGKGMIDREYLRLRSVKEIAASLGISTGYFRDKFRMAYGITPMQYLSQHKIRKAKELLANRSEKICDVAIKVGIPDRNVFRSTFRKFVGATPSEYRNMSLTGENNPRK